MWVLSLLALPALPHVNGLKSAPNLHCLISGSRSGTAIKAISSRANTNKGENSQAKFVKAVLTLADGTRFEGISFGDEKPINGEVVFTTGMVGYTESLTDPSYCGQILTLTYPMIGNYGVPDIKKLDKYGLHEALESNRIHASGLIVQDYSSLYSHWDAKMSLSDWLKQEGIPAVHGIDTRLLTKKLRAKGTTLGKIEFEHMPTVNFEDPNKRNLVAEVSTRTVKTYGKGNPLKILAVDCGIKSNIIRMLVDRGAEVKLVPWDYDIYNELPNVDGVFVSNGPGDPTTCQKTITELQKVLNAPADLLKPIFGICLGNQLLSLAAGAKTRKMPFGHRGQNLPVVNTITKVCYITSQNHGYAVCDEPLPKGWRTLFSNVNDGTNEGIIHETKPFFTAQFHPEAQGGPTDTSFLFDIFLNAMREKGRKPLKFVSPKPTIQPIKFKKVLLLGSGGLSIGQAGEFDYSGSQAIKALKEEGVEVVLMNPNIASVQTNVANNAGGMADQVYFLPVTTDYVEEILKKERPDGILISMGGQTALNVGVELDKKGILAKYGVKIMGTPVDTIIATEDREIFIYKLREIDEKGAPAATAKSVEQAKIVAKEIGYPVMIRAAYALGGLGSGICATEALLAEKSKIALALSPQILVEKSLLGWKEVEYEVVRDGADNCITVCNMENLDPLGVHTGDSIVVAPSQTLSNREYHMLRETAIKVVRHLGVVGECNIQFALNPASLDYCIIEVNARLSRSSALASKATGYPLAFVAAKVALGITLSEIVNKVTGATQACFEPSLDYCVTKVPRWDLLKFRGASRDIGTAMKSVGEVMGIGRTWEESIQKALRMTDTIIKGFQPLEPNLSKEDLITELQKPTDRRIYAIAQALDTNELTPEEITMHSNIDPWFIGRLKRIADLRKAYNGRTLASLSYDELRKAKQLGFSDPQLAALLKENSKSVTDDQVRARRLQLGIRPLVKQIDTLAAEFPSQTNYLYITYHGSESDVDGNSKSRIVLGSGCYRIGSSVEFDWCGVSTIRALKKLGYRSTMINFNPETVSTDYDECDTLYFEELSKERVVDIYEMEKSEGVVVSMGGQIPNNLCLPLHKSGVKIMGTHPLQVDRAEDREKFSRIIDALVLQQAEWRELADLSSALQFADRVGFPVLVRPSYVLSGAAMNVAHDSDALAQYLEEAIILSPDHPVVISRFILGAREVEMDGVAKDGEIYGCAIHEHVENAGVHSGDATLLLPTQSISEFVLARIEEAAKKIVKELKITGPFNIQYIVKDSDVLIIECNLRASRSFPFISKTMNADFIEAATKLMLDRPVDDLNLPKVGTRNRPKSYVGVKAPVFSFTRLGGADPVLGVEMASTGEVACFGHDKHDAFLKSLLSTGFKLPKKAIIVTISKEYIEIVNHHVYLLNEMGYKLFATPETHAFLVQKGMNVELIHYYDGENTVHPHNVLTMIGNNEVDLVINLPPDQSANSDIKVNYYTRRTAVDFGVPLLTNSQLFIMFVDALKKHRDGKITILNPESVFDYYALEAAATSQ